MEFQVQGAAWHVTDSRQIFEAMIGLDETANTQVVMTPGFERKALKPRRLRCSASGTLAEGPWRANPRH